MTHGKVHSSDLVLAVFRAFVKLNNKQEVARMFGKSKSWVKRLMRDYSPITGERNVKKVRGRQKITIAGGDANVMSFLEQNPTNSLSESAAALGTSRSTLHRRIQSDEFRRIQAIRNKVAEASKAPKKLTAKEKIAQKEAEKKRQEEEARQKLESAANRTPAEINAEIARIRAAQEQSDFDLARDTFFSEPSAAGAIDSFQPKSVQDFEQFRNMLATKIQSVEKSEFYSNFLQNLFQDLCLNLNSEDVRKCGAVLSALASEKAKKEKETTAKQSKGKGKKVAGLKGAGKKDDSMADYGDVYDDLDDLM